MGRKLVVMLLEVIDDGLAYRVDREGLTLRPHLLNIAEILQIIGFALPPDPARTSAATELLFGTHYHQLHIVRLNCTVISETPEVHVYSLSDEVDAEEAMALEIDP